MAPLPESIYFPSLDKILNGDQLLISWETTFDALLHGGESESAKITSLEQFFADSKVLELLAHPFKAFSAPSQQSKNAFETRTSAINVTPSLDTRYNIKEVKEDALWLSNQTKTDEVVALRIVLEECQGRPATQLLGPLSNEELASLQEAAGASQALSALLLKSDATEEDFNSQKLRRVRILKTYFSERRNLLKCLNILCQKSIYPGPEGPRTGKGKAPQVYDSWVQSIGKNLISSMGHPDSWIVEALLAIEINVRNLGTGSGWFKPDESGREEIETAWLYNQLMEISYTMEVIFQLIDVRPDPSSSTVILAWLRLVEQCNFFDQFPWEDPIAESLFLPIKSAAALISLLMINPGSCLEYLRTTDYDSQVSRNAPAHVPYIMNLDTITQVHTLISRASEFINAAPMVLAWADILQALVVQVSDEGDEDDFNRSHTVNGQDVYKETLERILQTDPDVDVIQTLASNSVDHGQVFQRLTDLSLRLGGTSSSYFSVVIGARMRLVILDLIRSSSTSIGYIPEVVEASLAALTGGQTYWDILDSQELHEDNDPLARIFVDTELFQLMIVSAKQRYPYESAFLKLTRALATCSGENGPLILDYISTIDTITSILPERFTGYTTTQEEENNNSIRLTAPLPLFEDRAATTDSSAALMRVCPAFAVPSATLGRMILEANPRVAYWFHSYRGLEYFGTVLESFVAASEVIDATTGGKADRDSVADIIGTFAGLLLSITRATEAASSSGSDAIATQHEAYILLESVNLGLGPKRDIVTIIFDIFEEELQLQSNTYGPFVSLDVLLSCVQFIHALLPIYPNRVWPLVGRSGLLEYGRGGGRLSSIVGNVELVSGRFDLLLSCSRLFEGLVEDFVSNAVQRLSDTRSAARFGRVEEVGRAIPHQVLSSSLLSFTRYFVDVLESSCTWKFTAYDDRRRLGKTLITTFDRILRYAYSLDIEPRSDTEAKPNGSTLFKSTIGTHVELDGPKKSNARLMGAILPAAAHLIDSFLSTSSGSLRFQPLMEALNDGFQTSPSTTSVNVWALCKDQVNATLSFSTTLLRAGTLLHRPQSQFENQLFKTSPLISRLYAVDPGYQLSVVALFEALLASASKHAGEPPSLLGYLGTQTSKNFLHVLSDLDKPLCRHDCVVGIWNFLATVVSNRQQWFANYLLTGKSAKNALKGNGSGKDSTALDRPILAMALDALSNINNLPNPEALAMLNFVVLAQNFWPWATYSSARHATFIKSISEYCGTLKPIQPSSKLDDSINACYQTKTAAYVAELLAMHLFHSRQTGNNISAKNLLPNLSYYTRFAVGVPQYNSSLHGNLKRNFEARYEGCSLLEFERTTLELRPLGPEYFYNVPFMDKALNHDAAWQQRNGFRAEVAIANVNLSLVDAQIALLHGWSFLAIELCNDLSKQPELHKTMVKVSADCLVSNRKSQGLQAIFQRLNERRAELALILTQRLIEANTDRKDMEGLLAVIWETIRSSDTSFERALTAGNAEYYRTLLKLLFLALRVHASNNDQVDLDFRTSTRLKDSESIIPIIVELLERVVATGIRELAAFVHEKPAEGNPEDIALITGILQACLRIPGIEFYYTQIVHMFSVNDTARVATTLYSWSDKLTVDGDPVYGELSMLFLLELSTMPSMAEQLAIEGILGNIGAANITAYLRRGNVSPFAESAGIQRCYNIWVRGVLPLLLNMLDAVGDSVGTEVALFINQFPSLLKQSSEVFDTPETSRTAPRGSTKHITLSTCSEVHSIALITYILNGFRGAGAETPDVKWDAANVVETVDFWLAARLVLRDRILPMGTRDLALRNQVQENSDFSNRLEEKIVGELLGIRDVLTEGGAA